MQIAERSRLFEYFVFSLQGYGLAGNIATIDPSHLSIHIGASMGLQMAKAVGFVVWVVCH
jgi:hypothetical protein